MIRYQTKKKKAFLAHLDQATLYNAINVLFSISRVIAQIELIYKYYSHLNPTECIFLLLFHLLPNQQALRH